jgi:hypothetical protein
MHRFKSTILAIFQFFWAKSIILKHYENGNKKNIQNMSQGLPNQGLIQEKVQKGNFSKKPLRELKNYFCFRFLRIPRTTGRVN